MRIFTTVLLFLTITATRSFAQVAENNIAAASAINYPLSLYKEATSMSQNLYNGRQYYVYDARQEEFQFFNQRKWVKGVIYYDGQRFDSIPMLYDIYKDELVIKHFNGDHVLVQSEKVDYFLLNNHHFARFESGTDINEQMRTGFYDILYDGKTRTLIRRFKSRQEKIVDKRVIALYPQKNFFYIYNNERYHSVNSKKSVLGLFPEQKKELRKVLKDEKIKFRKNKEVAIAKIVAKHDELAKP
ncbi:hypothetical protein [Dyadobacter arcticus]|uniref:DKNYY family protein n=1 Tax=Dyadobacter arcticus TaxID=1078754 RepID=A0ABX0UFC2_9BACT|nr:hypothetical protein [Dyadobacter arcticus]NIJ51367.1 hypothetical protein [Dyadobacter arcticus]